MKVTPVLVFGATFTGTHAHYFFDTLILNNTFTAPWEYIRKISPQPRTDDAFITDYDYIQPVVDPSSIDLRCGRNASTAWNSPKTAVVHAGDTIGFAVNTTVALPIKDAPVNPWDRYPNMYHPGPLTVWLSPSEDLLSYQGTNPWVKILSVVNRTAQSVPPTDDYTWKHQWGAYQAPSWNFTIPTSTPAGAYLLRIEQIYPVPVGELGSQGAQFYANCAHLRVVNDGDAKEPADNFKVNIPGVYTYGQPEIYRWVDIGNETFDIRDFVEPGPKVWEG